MIYDFKCIDRDCGFVFEEVVRNFKTNVTECPKSGEIAGKEFCATSNIFIPPYFMTMKSDIFDSKDWENLKKNPNIERAR